MRPALAALLLGTTALAAPLATPLAAQTELPARLAGHALIPAMSLIAPPPGAPREAWISGKFTGPVRVDAPMSVPGTTGARHGDRPTGIALPFIGQPLQGFSGFAMEPDAEGAVVAIIDNGFGSRANSTDALLYFTRIVPEWETGRVAVREVVWLSDPDGVVPFRIVHEGTEARHLTGGDFDPESIQVVGDRVWIGDEFGPYLIEATLDGRVTGVFSTLVEGAELRSPDHPALRVPAAAGADWRQPRSGGFEGLALQPGTGLLWAMLEKPMLGADGAPEGAFLRVLAFDPGARDWTGEGFLYRLEAGATAIGDFNFIDGTRALVIERDDGEGDPSLACAAGPAPDCFPEPARFKRVVLIDTAEIDADGFVAKRAFVDLMAIEDPDGIARLATDGVEPGSGRFTFPFFTIESVMRVDDDHILVAMDNNLPFSSGRRLDAAADNEFVLLNVPELLGAE